MDYAHSEIAKQFVLPERQSKIHSLLGAELDNGHHRSPGKARNGKRIKCWCGETDVKGFLISCDQCKRLLHGECVQIPEEEAATIEAYYCKDCRIEDPSLETRYRRVRNGRHHSGSSASGRRYSTSNYRRRSRSRSFSSSSPRSSRGRSSEDDRSSRSSSRSPSPRRREGRKRYSSASGSQSSSDDEDDRGRRRGKKVRERSPGEYLSDDEPMTPPLPKRPASVDRGAAGYDGYRSRERSSSGGYTPPPREPIQKKSRTPGRSPGRSRRPETETETDSESYESSDSESGSESGSESVSDSEDSSSSSASTDSEDVEARERKKKEKKRKTATREPSPPREPYGEDIRRQCMGPQCDAASRHLSKYCSDECGLRLNAYRLKQFLPIRTKEWKTTPCKADETNRKELEKVRNKLEKTHKRIMKLEIRLREHMALVERVKKLKPDLTMDDDDENATDLEGSMYCITCGMEVPSRQAVRHLEKCFARFESQMSFGSAFETKIEGESMFCDTFCTASGMYCKRLKVVCPEHYREPKGSQNEACGCPLTDAVSKPTGEYCLRLKRKCTKHFLWDRLRRAEIDGMRVKEFLTRDDLVEEERQIRTAMANRAGVLGLMLHSTHDHVRVEQQQRREMRKQLKALAQHAQAHMHAQGYGFASYAGYHHPDGRAPAPLPR